MATQTLASIPITASVPWAGFVLGLLVGTAAVAGAAAWLRTVAPGMIRRALGVRPAGRLEAQTLAGAIRSMSSAAGVPEPEVVVVPHRQVNLFVFAGQGGRPVLAFTEGALTGLGAEEIDAAVGAGLARTADPGLARATTAAGLDLVASSLASLGLVARHEAERTPLLWPLGLPFLLLGAAISRVVAGPPPGARHDLAGAEISGRALHSARLLERMEFTTYAAPLPVSGALARLALVDHRGDALPIGLSGLHPAPPPSAPRAAVLRGSSLTPSGPSRAQAA